MKWLEIIEIRTTDKDHDLLESFLNQLVEQIIKERKQKIKVYYKLNLETDFSIHLFHDSVKKSNTICSSLCTQLVSILKDFGIVDHTVWVERAQY